MSGGGGWGWRDRRFIGGSSQLSLICSISCPQVARALIWGRVHNAVPLYQLQLMLTTGLLSEMARHIGWTFICGVDNSWEEQKLCPLVPWSPRPSSTLWGPVTRHSWHVPKGYLFSILFTKSIFRIVSLVTFSTGIKLPVLFLNVTQAYDKPKANFTDIWHKRILNRNR